MSASPLTRAIIIPEQGQNGLQLTEDSPLLDLVSDLFTTDQSLQLENQKTQEAFQEFMTKMKAQFLTLSEENSLLRKELVAYETKDKVSDEAHEGEVAALEKQNAALRDALAKKKRGNAELGKKLAEEMTRSPKLQKSHNQLMNAVKAYKGIGFGPGTSSQRQKSMRSGFFYFYIRSIGTPNWLGRCFKD